MEESKDKYGVKKWLIMHLFMSNLGFPMKGQ
jgi:hypothetical protein